MDIRAPADCRDMGEVRAGIDRLDERLVELLAQRVRYVERAAKLKSAVGMPARVDDRVQAVLARVAAAARANGLPPDLAETLWTEMINWAIAHETRLMAASQETTDEG